MSDTVLAQLAQADIILLNKTDLVSRERREGVSDWLVGIAPGVRIISTRSADIPLDVIVGQHLRQPLAMAPALSPQNTHASIYQTLSVDADVPCDPERLAAALADARLGLLRAKGFVRRLDGSFASLHVVGKRAAVEGAPDWIEGPGRIVCIGLAHQINPPAISAAIEACSIAGAS
jgi:G3E family GTPase